MCLSENTFEVPVSSLDPSDTVVLSQAGPLRGGTPVTVTAVISSSPAGHLQKPRLLLGWQLSPTVLYKLLPMLRTTGRSGSGDRQARPSVWGLIRLQAGGPGTERPRRRGAAAAYKGCARHEPRVRGKQRCREEARGHFT